MTDHPKTPRTPAAEIGHLREQVSTLQQALDQERRRVDGLERDAERFRILSSIATEGVMIHADHVILDANQAFADILGLSGPGDLIGRNGMEMIRFTPESRQQLLAHIQSGATDAYPIEIVRPDGSVLPAETHGRSIEYRGRKARLVFMRDISEQRQADEALRESERNYREIFNATSDALFIHDETGRIVDVNERMCTMFGCDREWALGRPANELSLGESPYSEVEAFEHLRQAEAEGSKVFLWRSKRRGGDLFWSEVALRFCIIGGEKRVIASVRDVSERKEAEDALASEKRYVDALFESLPGVVYAYDEEGYLVRWNRNLETVFGNLQDEVTGQRLHYLETIAEPDRDRVTRAFAEILATGQGEVEFMARTRNGNEIPYHAWARAVDLAGKRYVVGTGFDVSERIRSDQEREILHEQLQHSMKMEAVGRLAGGVAHDFNNLLTVISGNVELADGVADADDPLRPYLEQVSQAAASAANLTRQLLAFSRRQILEPRAANLNELVAGVRNLLTRLIGENIVIETRLADDLGAVNIDQTQFEQVLVNLAVNARDAMPDGGELVIETANVDLSAVSERWPAELQPGPFVKLTVADTGHGMSEDVKRHAFEPFFTTKTTGQGTGLGLATIFGAVKQAGGTIEIESAIGRGTSFQIYLPRIAGDTAKPSGNRSAQQIPHGSETILLVEDDQGVRELAHAFLSKLGYTVLLADSGNAAVFVVAEHDGRIDLLLTDLVMPGLGGRETAARISALQPDLRVLYMSGYTDDIVLRQGLVEDSVNFIAKPFDLKTLAVRLREVIDSV